MKFSVNFGGETEPLGGETHPAGLYADKPLSSGTSMLRYLDWEICWIQVRVEPSVAIFQVVVRSMYVSMLR